MQHPHSAQDEHQEHGHDHEHGDHPHGIRGRGSFIISGLTGGHGVFHWFSQSFIAMLPEVQAAFALSGIGVGGITSVRELVSGVVTLPGGIIADGLRKHWGLVLALCMAVFGVGWLIVGIAPSYYVLLIGMAVVALAASIWHLPAMASLSHHFSHRRGTALSFHGVGGQIGDVLAPPGYRSAARLPRVARHYQHLRRNPHLPRFPRLLGIQEYRQSGRRRRLWRAGQASGRQPGASFAIPSSGLLHSSVVSEAWRFSASSPSSPYT